MNINAVEERSGNALTIPLHLPWRTPALALRVTIESARTRIHRRDQHDVRRKSQTPRRTRDGHLSVFQGLAHHFERRSLKLRQFVEKKHAVVRKAYLTRRRIGRTAKKSDIGDRVVRRAEGTDGDKVVFPVEQPADAVDLGCLDRFLQRHGRHDPGNPLGQHALARPRSADHKQVVSTSDRDFKSPLHRGLALHIGKIQFVALVVSENRIEVGLRPLHRFLSVEKFETFPQIAHTKDGESLHHRSLRRVFRRNEQRFLPAPPRFDGNGQHAFDRPDRAGQSQLSGDGAIRQPRQVASVRDGQHPDGDGQIEARPLLFNVRRSKIDRRASARPPVTAVRHGGGHAILTLFHRCVRQSDDDHLRVTGPFIHLDLHLPRIGAMQGSGINFGQHSARRGKTAIDSIPEPLLKSKVSPPTKKACSPHAPLSLGFCSLGPVVP